jgi:hypothetical protein
MVTFGSEQYVWHGQDASAHADPNLPPVISSIDATAQAVFTLPKASVTVLCGKVEGLTPRRNLSQWKIPRVRMASPLTLAGGSCALRKEQ